ncbi:hypothetical protein N0V94_005159 [Neodidymelliopsis sp. IMI 364377]|nr:hypothetical protein N0V94_005159 [Neodidymelliopsis sp. IMI 364377]
MLNSTPKFDTFKADPAMKLEPDSGPIQRPASNIRRDILYRLRWDLFGSLSDIQAWDTFDHNDCTPVPFFGHPMASELLTAIPFDHLEIEARAVEDRFDFIECKHDSDDQRWKGPQPLILKNSADSPITVGKFVTAIHEYFNDDNNKAKIMECIDMFYSGPPTHHGGNMYSFAVEADGTWPPRNKIPKGATHFFQDLREYGPVEGEWRIGVNVFTEGDMGYTPERFWEKQKMFQKRYEKQWRASIPRD